MKFKINALFLTNILSKFFSKNFSSTTLFQDLVFVVEKEQITILVENKNFSINGCIFEKEINGLKIFSPGIFSVNFKKHFLEITKNYNDEIEFEIKNGLLVIKNNKDCFTIPVNNSNNDDRYSKITLQQSRQNLLINASDFKGLINNVCLAIDNLSGCKATIFRLQLEGNFLFLWAQNHTSLVQEFLKVNNTDQLCFDIVLQHEYLDLITNLNFANPNDIFVSKNQDKIYLQQDNLVFQINSTENVETYFDEIPKVNYDKGLTIEQKTFSDALKKACAIFNFSEKNQDQITLEISQAQIIFKTFNKEDEKAFVVISKENYYYKDIEFKISLNYYALQKSVSFLKNEIHNCFAGKKDPVLVKSLDLPNHYHFIKTEYEQQVHNYCFNPRETSD